METRKKSVVRNYIYNAAYQILNIIAPLITAPYIARVLGTDNIGIYSYTISIATYFITLAILGSEGYARREIAFRKNDKNAYSKIFWELWVFRTITTAISLLMYLFLIIHLKNCNILFIQSLNIIVVAIDISWLFQGLEEFRTTAFRSCIFKLLNIISIFLCVKKSDDLVVYALLLGGLSVLSQLSLWLPARKLLIKCKPDMKHVFSHTKGILKLFIPTIAVAIYGVLDKTMIGIIAPDMSQNGYYEQAEKIIKMLITVISALGFVIAPRIAEEFARDNKPAIREYMKKSYRFIWTFALPMMFGIYALAEMIVPWFYGPGYDGVIPIIKIMGLLIPILSFSSLTGVQYLISTKKETVYTVSLFVGAGINFICNLILIPKFYAYGAAIATVIGEGSIALFQMIYVVKRDNIITYREMLVSFVKCSLFGCIMVIAVLVARNTLSSYTIANTFALAVLGMVIYFVLMVISQDQMMMELLNRIKGKFK